MTAGKQSIATIRGCKLLEPPTHANIFSNDAKNIGFPISSPGSIPQPSCVSMSLVSLFESMVDFLALPNSTRIKPFDLGRNALGYTSGKKGACDDIGI